MPANYEPLRSWLSDQDVDELRMAFEEIDALVGGLPPSSAGRTWWANSGKGQARAWMEAGWIVASVDLVGRHVTLRRGEARSRTSISGGWGRQSIGDGAAALEDTLLRAGWRSVTHAVAAYTIFLDPATVAQTGGRAVFPVVRDPARRGQFGRLADGRAVLFDDNSTPTDVFLWAAQRTRGRDVQFNHVWSAPSNPDTYTALWNLCCTPAFLAKTTDTHPEVVAALRCRALQLLAACPKVSRYRSLPPSSTTCAGP